MKTKGPSRKASRLVTRFEQSAGHDYWMRDQGVGRGVDQARDNCDLDRLILLKYIAQLERRAARAAGAK